ncbi:MAG TPA: KUP/HAK/KT family potassium transporter [Bacteroidales bacterium]|nr:KUP/HAK/KT family potassium transporter [Bacteroidales bacterium]HSA43733.1 KUP/HAK/KT family potassium transporter [Bacteroidales bacterium]
MNGKVTAATLLVALGIIYGDIGTSPLYVLKAIAGDRPVTEMLIYGGVSCIFWTLTIQTTFKYIFLTLKADNHGEGGIFSLYALVRKYRKSLALPTILGATTLLADGIITPPISVASAVEGLTILPGLENLQTVPIVIVILSALFFFQRFGTYKVGRTFGPVMLLWFTMLSVLGGIQIIRHPDVLFALNPLFAINLLRHYPGGFWLLGAVFLATTGAEALYSDLGHCGRKNIRISWMFVKTCLMLNYTGQAAWIVQTGADSAMYGTNPFFGMMPSWFLIPGITIATLATIIASQAMISGSYTLINEAMNLNFWPRIKVKQPTNLKGQIYIPSVNNLLWFGCILMILYFRNSSHMEAAYGFSITITMLMTTLLLAHYLYYSLKWPAYLVGLILLLFSITESSFFIANVAKIKERWMFLIFELLIFITMYVWYYARKINNRFTHFTDLGKYASSLTELHEDVSIPKFSTHLIYLTKANRRHEIEEKIMRSIFSRNPKRADIYWFLHINRTVEPYTLSYDVSELVQDTVIKVNINIGFRIQPRAELYFKKIVRELISNRELNLHNRPDGSTRYNREPDFKFVVIEKFLSVENEFSLRDGILLNTYFLMKKWGLSDQKAFGLDKCDVVTEYVPLVYQPVNNIELKKENHHSQVSATRPYPSRIIEPTP